jgi:hypothetical protein
MFTNEEIAEVMVEEIGETRTGQSRTRVPSAPEDNGTLRGVLYLRRSSTCGKTTYRDINIFEPCASPRGRIGSQPIIPDLSLSVFMRRVLESKGNLVFSDPEVSRSYDLDGSVRPTIDTGYRHVRL